MDEKPVTHVHLLLLESVTLGACIGGVYSSMELAEDAADRCPPGDWHIQKITHALRIDADQWS